MFSCGVVLPWRVCCILDFGVVVVYVRVIVGVIVIMIRNVLFTCLLDVVVVFADFG